MKIFYAVQATGNGHISRAMELLPHLQQYGEVDIFLSGANSSLKLDGPVKYRSAGLSLFYTCNGSLDYMAMARQFSPTRLRKEINELPVDKYDLVINDFECITSLACSRRRIPSIHFGHQASFLSANTPRPKRRNRVGEWLLRNYVRSTDSLGLHFESYDDFILTPVIKKQIWDAQPSDQGYITVYLPSYCDAELLRYLKPLREFRFQVFSKEVASVKQEEHITFIPVSYTSFNESMIHCTAMIIGAGFETPAEALHLKKRMIVIPIKGQYEQLCNAAALERIGIISLNGLNDNFASFFRDWFEHGTQPDITFKYSSADIIRQLMEKAHKNQLSLAS